MATAEQPPKDSLVVALESFRATINARNRREWIACAFVAIAFTVIAVQSETVLSTVSAAEIVAAAAYVAWRLRRHGRVRLPSAAALPHEQLPQLYAAELQRHAKLLHSVPWWYVLPLAVGVFGLMISETFAPNRPPGTDVLFPIAVGAAIFGAVALLNLKAAANLRTRAADVIAGRGDPRALQDAARARWVDVALLLIGIAIVLGVLAIYAFELR